jgi:hypothetical protein
MAMLNMKTLTMKNPLEMVLLALFVLYLVFPVATPFRLAPYVDSGLGLLVVLAVVVFLFMYSHPVLAVVYVFVAYELIRRSSLVTGRTAYIQYTPTQQKRDQEMARMNPPAEVTLEENVVAAMAPVGHPMDGEFMETVFKPVADPVHSASMV